MINFKLKQKIHKLLFANITITTFTATNKLYNMKYLKRLLAASLIVVAFAACDKNEMPVEDLIPTDFESLYLHTDYNLEMLDFATAINEAINSNKSFRKLVKEETFKMFDGDFDVLLSNIVDAKVENYKQVEDGMPMRTAGNVSVRDLLNSSFQAVQERTITEGNSEVPNRQQSPRLLLIDQIIAKYPALQIAIPFLEEQLEDENYIPPVVFLPEEYNEENTKFLPAMKGELKYAQDAINLPDNACIVISMNERMSVIQDDVPPPTPVSLTGHITDFGIALSWVMPVETNETNTSGYKIYRTDVVGDFELVHTSYSCYNYSYLDNDVKFNKIYQYYMVSYNSYQTSRPVYSDLIIVDTRISEVANFTVRAAGLGSAKLEWTVGDDDYKGKVNVFKRSLEDVEAFPSIPIFSFDYGNGGQITEEYIERNITPGTRWEYKMERQNAIVSSSPKYDIFCVPYRDAQTNSKVYIRGIKCTNNSKIESWRGAPEYKIKIMRAKWNGTKYITNIEREVRIDLPRGTKDNQYTWISVKDGLLTDSWKLRSDGENWYDVYYFYVVEYDGGVSAWEEIKLTAQAVERVYTTLLTSLRDVSVTAKVLPTWIKYSDEKIGYAYLNYYDNPHKEVTIQASEADCQVTIKFSDSEDGH
jgi:hypothetical protein